MFKDGQPNGYNTYQYKNGDTYTGWHKNGKLDGYGIYRWTDQGATYHGQYNEDKKEGYGTEKYDDNDEYDGQWENGNRSGEAVYTYAKPGIIRRELWKDDNQVKVLETLQDNN